MATNMNQSNVTYLELETLRSLALDAQDIYVYLLALRNAMIVLRALYPYAPEHLQPTVISVIEDIDFAQEVGRRANHAA